MVKKAEKVAAKQQKYRQRKKEKVKVVAKKMIPTFVFATLIAILVFLFLFLQYPFPLLRLSKTDVAKCENVYYQDVMGKSGVFCYIVLDNGNKYFVPPASVSLWGGFKATEFEEAVDKNQTFIISYITNNKQQGADCITLIKDIEGNVYLKNWDVLRHVIFFWCIAWFLYILSIGFFIWYKWNTIYRQTEPGDV